MRRKKKTTIVTFESRERMTIRHETPRIFAWCDRCGDEVLMVAPNEAAAISRTDTRTIFRAVEAERVHFIEGENGALLVCTRSLARIEETGGAASG
jgi:hypothetical protein